MSGNQYEWNVVSVEAGGLSTMLNGLEREWEIFAVAPVMQFDARVMGTPVPSGVQFTIIARRKKS